MTPHVENQDEKGNEKTFRCVHCSQVKGDPPVFVV